jgi:hypothetical protein
MARRPADGTLNTSGTTEHLVPASCELLPGRSTHSTGSLSTALNATQVAGPALHDRYVLLSDLDADADAAENPALGVSHAVPR